MTQKRMLVAVNLFIVGGYILAMLWLIYSASANLYREGTSLLQLLAMSFICFFPFFFGPMVSMYWLTAIAYESKQRAQPQQIEPMIEGRPDEIAA